MWTCYPYFYLTFSRLLNYFTTLSVGFHELNALWGFFAILTIVSQFLSGFVLSLSYIPEPMLVPMSRDEEDMDGKLVEECFWLHERGVDLLFIFTYLHIFRKLYLCCFEYEHENTWKSGTWTFIIFQVVVFFGLSLCCSHLSEITLTIAANIFHTFFLFKGKFYWWVFTDKQLNSDTLIRLTLGHYASAVFMFYLAILHSLDMHYDWKTEQTDDSLKNKMSWWDEAFSNELSYSILVLFIILLFCYYFYEYPEPLTYELFMWGDVGMVTDIRFYGVSPHWYFRPLMAWLLVCPFHKMGISGLVLFFLALFYQPGLHSGAKTNFYSRRVAAIKRLVNRFMSKDINFELNIVYQISYGCFIVCTIYTLSFLPYGKFYNRIGGNIAMLLSYSYLFLFLLHTCIRKPLWLEYLFYYSYIRCFYLLKFCRKRPASVFIMFRIA